MTVQWIPGFGNVSGSSSSSSSSSGQVANAGSPPIGGGLYAPSIYSTADLADPESFIGAVMIQEDAQMHMLVRQQANALTMGQVLNANAQAQAEKNAANAESEGASGQFMLTAIGATIKGGGAIAAAGYTIDSASFSADATSSNPTYDAKTDQYWAKVDDAYATRTSGVTGALGDVTTAGGAAYGGQMKSTADLYEAQAHGLQAAQGGQKAAYDTVHDFMKTIEQNEVSTAEFIKKMGELKGQLEANQAAAFKV